MILADDLANSSLGTVTRGEAMEIRGLATCTFGFGIFSFDNEILTNDLGYYSFGAVTRGEAMGR